MRYTFDMQTDNTTAASNFQASYQPLYEQIKKMLTQSLIDGEWRAGELIPSEMELASRFGVSPGTVRKAIDDLVSENILVRSQARHLCRDACRRGYQVAFPALGRQGWKKSISAQSAAVMHARQGECARWAQARYQDRHRHHRNQTSAVVFRAAVDSGSHHFAGCPVQRFG